MTNFIKLKIEKKIKNDAGELQGFEWVEVYVNADNISHFKKVKNRLYPNKNVEKIYFTDEKYKDSTYYSRLEKYLLKSKTQDAFLKDEFSDFIQECVHVQPRKTALRRSGAPGGQRQCADMLPRGDEAEFGIKLQHRAVGIKINAVAGAAPVVQYGFHQPAGKALAAVLRSRHHRAQLHQPQRLATPHRVDAVDRDVGCRAAVPVYHRIGNVAVRPPARAVPFLERKAENTPGQCEKTLPQGSIVPHLLDERIVHAPFPLSPAALCAAASSAGHCTIFPRRRKGR